MPMFVSVSSVEAITMKVPSRSAGSYARRSHRIEPESVVGLSGPRTLLMQAAHPVAFAGFFAHTGALDEPYERLQRTVRVLGLIGFGDKAQAQKATARVRAIHERVHGELSEAARPLPGGTP